MKFSDNNVFLQNWELISSIKAGDIMTVVSLLNSGADVQTKNEVCIRFLSSPVFIFTPRGFFHSSIFMLIRAIL